MVHQQESPAAVNVLCVGERAPATANASLICFLVLLVFALVVGKALVGLPSSNFDREDHLGDGKSASESCCTILCGSSEILWHVCPLQVLPVEAFFFGTVSPAVFVLVIR